MRRQLPLVRTWSPNGRTTPDPRGKDPRGYRTQQAEHQRRGSLTHEKGTHGLERTQALHSLLMRICIILEELGGEVSELDEEADDTRCLQVLQEMARDMETLPKELEGVIEDKNHSVLIVAATCVFSNVCLVAPTADLRALIAALPIEASETLALEVKECMDAMLWDFFGTDGDEEI